MLLRRFSYPCRYSDMISWFGRPVPELCMIMNEVMDNFFNNHSHRIPQWNRIVLSSPLMQEYADAIHAKGSPLENCFGFIDGTVRPIARPNQQQRIVYNCHKRVHSLKFQSVALPNELIGNMYGPVGKLLIYIVCHVNLYPDTHYFLWGWEAIKYCHPVSQINISVIIFLTEGKRHDASMLVGSNILHELKQNTLSPTGKPLCVFGDPAYPLWVHLQAPYYNGILTPIMEVYSAEMSSVRYCWVAVWQYH